LAVDCFERSLEQFAESSFSTLGGWCYINLGGCLIELKRFDEARKYLEKGLINARERGEKPMLLVDMIYFSVFFSSIGQTSRAVRVFSAVEALRARINAYSEWSTYKSLKEKLSHLVNDHMKDPLYANDVEAGKQFTLEQLIAFVLEKDKKEAIV
jgi:hypothetical protein